MEADIGQDEIKEIIAKEAIRKLLVTYARGIDRADAELLATVFHPNSTVVTGAVNGTGPYFVREIVSYVTANLDRCFHSIGGGWIEVRGRRAWGEFYVIATAMAGDTATFAGGRYIDEFEMYQGKWLIKSHVFVSDWSMTRPLEPKPEQGALPRDTLRGCFGRDDPVFTLWSKIDPRAGP